MKKSQLTLLLICALTINSMAQINDFIIKKELIFPAQSEHAHGSSLALLPNGDKLACWFQGSGERNSDDVQNYGCQAD
jgi:predicted neuraminidase